MRAFLSLHNSPFWRLPPPYQLYRSLKLVKLVNPNSSGNISTTSFAAKFPALAPLLLIVSNLVSSKAYVLFSLRCQTLRDPTERSSVIDEPGAALALDAVAWSSLSVPAASLNLPLLASFKFFNFFCHVSIGVFQGHQVPSSWYIVTLGALRRNSLAAGVSGLVGVVGAGDKLLIVDKLSRSNNYSNITTFLKAMQYYDKKCGIIIITLFREKTQMGKPNLPCGPLLFKFLIMYKIKHCITKEKQKNTDIQHIMLQL